MWERRIAACQDTGSLGRRSGYGGDSSRRDAAKQGQGRAEAVECGQREEETGEDTTADGRETVNMS